MATNEIAAAARAICEEKGIPLEAVIATIESALAAAYRKDFGEKNQNIKVNFDLDTGTSTVFDERVVVDDVPEEEVAEDSADVETTGKEKAAEPVHEPEIRNHPPAGEAGKSETRNSDDKDEEKTNGEKATAGEAAADVVEEDVHRFNPRTEVQISDLPEFLAHMSELTGKKTTKKSYKIGDVITTELPVPAEYGRMAAQTAKQVIIQRLREIERGNIYEEYKGKEHEVVTGVVQRREGKIVIVDIGKTTGIIPPDGQAVGEHYDSGQRIKVYVEAVNMTARGPEILLSRTSPEIVRKVFINEIPEIANGLIEIKSVAREAGARSKIAVAALEENVDPIGSCVGQRGARIQTIISELGGEKVDIIEYSEDLPTYVSQALAPAKVVSVAINEERHQATALVGEDQLSLAIGRGGQNVRLAAKLTGWRIDVKGAGAPEKTEDEEINIETDSEVGQLEGDGVDENEEKENKKTTKQKNKEGEVASEAENANGEKIFEEAGGEDKK